MQLTFSTSCNLDYWCVCYDKSIAPFLSGHAKKLVDMAGDSRRERQWLHQCLALGKGNAASIFIGLCASL